MNPLVRPLGMETGTGHMLTAMHSVDMEFATADVNFSGFQ